MERVLAAADVGSNTVHLLIAGTDGKSVLKINEESEWLNLGEVVAREGSIPTHLADQLVVVLVRYRSLAAFERADGIYVFGTEAIRRATNSAAILSRIESETGLKVDLIDSATEARLGTRGALMDSAIADRLLVAEVGGGSAQLSSVENGKTLSSVSLPLGTGTLIGRHNILQPSCPKSVDRMRGYVAAQIGSAAKKIAHGEKLVASGGVARGLWRALHPDGDREIGMPELEYLLWTSQRLTIDQIVKRFRVKARRAATIMPGAAVFLAIATACRFEGMLVSRHGVREGAILEMGSGGLEPWPV